MLSKKTKVKNLKVIKDALMTQKRLAAITHIHEVRLSRALKGELDFTEDELEKIAKALNVELTLAEDGIVRKVSNNLA